MQKTLDIIGVVLMITPIVAGLVLLVSAIANIL